MKKTIVVVVALCLSAAVPSLADFYAGTADVTRTLGYYDAAAGRGEYTISNSLLNNSNYASEAIVPTAPANSFQTFCIERFEDATNPAHVVVSTTAIDELTGAVVGEGTHAVQGRKIYGDNLEAQTAYLYTLFATGNLSGYDYTPGAGRGASAKSLQLAIWEIEEKPLDALTDTQALAWIAAADAAIARGAWEGIGSVRVLNMYGPTVELAQDMLYFVPVPGAVLLGFLGLGAAGLKLRKLA